MQMMVLQQQVNDLTTGVSARERTNNWSVKMAIGMSWLASACMVLLRWWAALQEKWSRSELIKIGAVSLSLNSTQLFILLGLLQLISTLLSWLACPTNGLMREIHGKFVHTRSMSVNVRRVISTTRWPANASVWQAAECYARKAKNFIQWNYAHVLKRNRFRINYILSGLQMTTYVSLTIRVF